MGLDLAGDEIGFPNRQTEDHFFRAHESGLHVTVHAGEAPAGTPHATLARESIRVAIHELGAERLGHAVRAVDDPGLLELIKERNIGIESCLSSNLQTGIIPSLAEHPLLTTFLEHGLLVTLQPMTPVSPISLWTTSARSQPRRWG